MAIKLSTGKIAFPIEFDNGDVQNIYFNPNDPNLPVRIKNLESRIKSRIGELRDVSIDTEGNPTTLEMIDEFHKLQNILYEELDIAFGGEICAVVFKYCSPFAIVDGQYFFAQFIEAIVPEIQKAISNAKIATEKRMQKHTAKYLK